MLPWQKCIRCHFVSFVMYISGAKFDDCSKMSGDILNSVFYRFSGTIYDVITFLICIMQKRDISKTKKDIPKRKTPFFFQISSNYFLLHRHFKEDSATENENIENHKIDEQHKLSLDADFVWI